ncbi:MAG: zinc ABC transporter substrate-binding protein [Bacteroidales bacterium]|nr:zinc ABC transporter substrate-binding protein [Bacteroidales bacterium]
MSRNTLIISLLLLLIACNPDSKRSDKLIISVSILPQQYFIERIAGEMVEVNVMIPPGASPATYEPTFSQLSKLDQSLVYLRIGYIGFELSWMNKISAVNPDLKIVDLSTGINPIRLEEEEHHHLHEHAHGGVDPHIWMSVLNAKIIARNTFNELIQHFPEEEEKLTARFSNLLLEFDTIDDSIAKMLSDQKERSFMIYHPALSYFARDYNLEQFSLEIGGKTPSPAHMKWMIDLGREKNISTIFLQQQFDQKNAEVLANEIGAKIVQINPLDPDWHSQMLFIANQLKTFL